MIQINISKFASFVNFIQLTASSITLMLCMDTSLYGFQPMAESMPQSLSVLAAMSIWLCHRWLVTSPRVERLFLAVMTILIHWLSMVSETVVLYLEATSLLSRTRLKFWAARSGVCSGFHGSEISLRSARDGIWVLLDLCDGTTRRQSTLLRSVYRLDTLMMETGVWHTLEVSLFKSYYIVVYYFTMFNAGVYLIVYTRNLNWKRRLTCHKAQMYRGTKDDCHWLKLTQTYEKHMKLLVFHML